MGIAAAETVIAWQSHEGVRISRGRGFDVIACEMCGFRHVVPLPDLRALDATYREAYYRDDKPRSFARLAEDEDWAALFHNDRLDAIERLLAPSRRRLLDVGSGAGFFLKVAKSRGWRVLGIDPSKQAAQHARALGIEVTEGFFDAETASGLGRFDAVQLNTVLEHVPDPAAILIAARDLLEQGGVLSVTVPNDFSPFQIAARGANGSDEWWIAPKLHLNYFDFDSLGGLLERLEFRVVERMTSFPMELFLLMGEDYVADPEVGRAAHEKRKRFDAALENAGFGQTRRAFYRALARAGLGREATVIAVKS